MDNYSNVYQLEAQLLDKMEKLSIKQNDILIISCPPESKVHLEQYARHIKEQIIDRCGIINPLILLISNDIKIQQLNEEQMNKFGWYKQVEDDIDEEPLYI